MRVASLSGSLDAPPPVWNASRTATDPTNTVVANQGVCRTDLTSHPQLCGFAVRAHRLSAHPREDHAQSHLTQDTNTRGQMSSRVRTVTR